MSKRKYKPSAKKQAELKKVINNYNAKIRRLENKGIDKDFIEDKTNLKNELSNLGSTKEINDAIKRMKKFTEKGSENVTKYNGVEITKYQKGQLQTLQRKQNSQRKQLDKIANEQNAFGEGYGDAKFLGDITRKTKPKMDFKNIKDSKHAKEKIKKGYNRMSLKDKERKNEILYYNFLSAIIQNIPEHYPKIEKYSSKLSYHDFYELYRHNQDILHIPYLYTAEDRQEKAEQIITLLKAST